MIYHVLVLKYSTHAENPIQLSNDFSWARVPETKLKIRKKINFLEVLNKPIFQSFSKISLKKKVVVFSHRPLSITLKFSDHTWHFPIVWKQESFCTYCIHHIKDQIACTKKWKLRPRLLQNYHCNTISCGLLNHLWCCWNIITWNSMQIQISSERETR